MGMLGQQQQPEIEIVEFVLIEMGTYQNQYYRPFEINADYNNINALGEATNGGQVLDITNVEQVASNIISPQSKTNGMSQIPNGWATRRFSFVMRVIEKPRFSQTSTVERIFYGYTDVADLSFGKNDLDPNMRLYFNSEMTINTDVRPGPQGVMIPMSRVMSSTQIVSPMDMAGGNAGLFGDSIYLIRPEDVFLHNHDVSQSQILQQTGVLDGSVERFYDTRGMSTKGGHYKLNRRQDNSPSRYLQRFLSGYDHGIRESRESYDGGIVGDSILTSAAQKVKNPELHQLDFFEILKMDCGYLEQGFVRYGDLCNVFPTLNNVAEFTINDGRSVRRLSEATDSAYWNGGNYTSIAVSMLAQVVPSVMMENFIRQINFTVTSGNGYGEYFIDVDKNSLRMMSSNLPDQVVQRSISEFKRRISLDVLNYVTRYNQLFCQIGMVTNLQSESVIDIALDSHNVERYVAPTFSDGLFTPVATNEVDRRNLMCESLGYLVRETFDHSVQQPTMDYAPQQSFSNPTLTRDHVANPYGQQQPQSSGSAFAGLPDDII
jgi:hypothetical protein|tara:strand:+ start:5313 stop:6953 length:1641 start_codon:yes stop_codon:yes gene_type:complete